MVEKKPCCANSWGIYDGGSTFRALQLCRRIRRAAHCRRTFSQAKVVDFLANQTVRIHRIHPLLLVFVLDLLVPVGVVLVWPLVALISLKAVI